MRCLQSSTVISGDTRRITLFRITLMDSNFTTNVFIVLKDTKGRKKFKNFRDQFSNSFSKSTFVNHLFHHMQNGVHCEHCHFLSHEEGEMFIHMISHGRATCPSWQGYEFNNDNDFLNRIQIRFSA